MSVAGDFGVTQVVDGNRGVHAIIKKNLFARRIVHREWAVSVPPMPSFTTRLVRGRRLR
jgi:hypothetical protein